MDEMKREHRCHFQSIIRVAIDLFLYNRAEASPHLMMQVALLHENPQQEATLVRNSSDQSYAWRRALEGKLVSSGHVVRDLDGQKSCFFVFPDLSVRLEGSFRLKFTLLRIGPNVM